MKRKAAIPCPNSEHHTPCPVGYIAWHTWAEEMEAKGWESTQCPSCGLWAIWLRTQPAASAGPAEEVERE